MTHQHPRCAQGLEVEERELMSIQELKICMMQMPETQRVWWCQCMETAPSGPGSQKKQGLGFLFSALGEAWFYVSLWSAFCRERLSEREVEESK